MREPGSLRGCAVRRRIGLVGLCVVPVLRAVGSGAAVTSEVLQVSGVIRVDCLGSDLSFHVTSAAITGLGRLTGAA